MNFNRTRTEHTRVDLKRLAEADYSGDTMTIFKDYIKIIK